ncbi:hypothetical protein QR98_0047950 [Sarcoptes scabiei]|uniref:FAK1-like FERM domain-containing protein n=1 Tax=Sarcoptes scabiei TaxID=52283 RepID=A0A132A5T3_SARSC|nr:hypothetical protein QR98_0047950 [Sarcoptes scabiei]
MSASSSILNEMTNQNAEIFINIYWPVKNRTEIQILNYQTAFDVIKQMLHNQVYAPISMNLKRNRSNSSFNLSRIEENTQYAYALRLICRNSKTNSDQIWIHPIENMMEFLNQNKHLIEKGWKLELRIRYLPSNLEEFYRNDYLSFKFLYEQVLEEFFSLELSTTKLLSNQDLILELGCYEIFRTHPYLTPQGLEKNSNWEALENDFHRIFPISFTNSMKESIWKVPIDLMIDPNVGIAYFISKSSPATIIVKSFDMIEEINIINQSTANRSLEKHSMIDLNAESRNVHSPTKKILLNLKIKNENDVLVISCPSLSMAQSIADLIDGYHRVVTNNPETIWLNQKQLSN